MMRRPSAAPPVNVPGWFFDPPPRLATYTRRGSRLGLVLAGVLGAVATIFFGLTGALAELVLADVIPGVGLIFDGLTLLTAVGLLVFGYYLGMIGGWLVYLIAFQRWRAQQRR